MKIRFRPDMKRYLQSLTSLNGALDGKVKVEGRMFKVTLLKAK